MEKIAMESQSWTPRVYASEGIHVPAWLQFPDFVLAPSPKDRGLIARFSINPNFAVVSAQQGRMNPAFELWCQVLGRPPQVPNVNRQRNGVAEAGLLSLRNAHACFRGIKRPIGEDDDGSSVLSYITKPSFSFEYFPDMVTVAKKFVYPADLVFITNVKLDSTYTGGDMIPEGVVTHWGSVEGDDQDSSLPQDYERRFDQRLW